MELLQFSQPAETQVGTRPIIVTRRQRENADWKD